MISCDFRLAARVAGGSGPSVVAVAWSGCRRFGALSGGGGLVI